MMSKERLWRRAKVGDNILEFGSFDLLRALVKINRKRRDFLNNIYYVNTDSTSVLFKLPTTIEHITGII